MEMRRRFIQYDREKKHTVPIKNMLMQFARNKTGSDKKTEVSIH